MTADRELPSGTLVDHRYRIQRVLGRGGFGRTYLAADARRFNELCVLKEFIPSGRGDSVFRKKLRELFLREATILHRLNHPQIPKFFASFEEDGRLFIVQEYVTGKTYWRVLQERQQQGQAFTEAEVTQWLQDLLRVLDYIHRLKIVHRDISPDNIMLPKDGTIPILIDFGVVKQATHLHGINVTDAEDLIQASVSVGKFGYAPYEQIRMGQCSARSDIYALAVTAVVLLTGKPPNQLIDPKTLEWRWQRRVTVHPDFAQILNKMMAEKPQDRYPSARIVLQDLQQLKGADGEAMVLSQATPVVAESVVAEAASVVDLHLVRTLAEPLATATAVETQIQSETHAELKTYLNTNLKTELEPIDVQPSPSKLGGKQGAGQEAGQATGQATGQAAKQATASRRAKINLWLHNQRKYHPLWQVLSLCCLALLPIGGAIVGVRSPYITEICSALDNCAEEQGQRDRYHQAIEQAQAAQSQVEQAQSVDELVRASERLKAAIAMLHQIVPHSKLHDQIQESISTYTTYLSNLDTRLQEESRAAALLQRAESEAKTASDQMQVAKTAEAYTEIQQQWRRAIATLQAVPETSLVAQEASVRSQTYGAKVRELEQLISSQPTPTPASEAEARPTPGSAGWAWIPSTDAQPPVAAAPNPPSTSAPATRPAPPAPASPTVQQSAPTARSAPATRPAPSPAPAPQRTPTPSPVRPSTVASSPAVSQPQVTTRPPAPSSPPRTTLTPAAASPARVASQPAVSNMALSSIQTLNDVSIRIEGAAVRPSGNLVGSLVIENQSNRVFGFVPLFAEVRDGSGQAVRSRILFSNGRDATVAPGDTLRGEVYVFDRTWNRSGAQNMTLIIREGTSGNRNFQISF